MEILFKNVTQYTKEEMARFQKFHKSKNYNKYKFWTISLLILFISFFILNILYRNWYAAVGTMFLAVMMYVYYYYTMPKRKKENNKKQLAQKFIFGFTNKYIEVKADKVDNKISYHKFHRVYETKTNFYLYIDDEYAILINKNGFVLGTLNEFRKFIKKRMMFKYRLEK